MYSYCLVDVINIPNAKCESGINCISNPIIQIYSGITSGRVLDGELLYTKILEVNLIAFAYRLFHADFSPIYGAEWREIFMKQSVGKCNYINF